MDYIQEELLRQQAALGRYLLGITGRGTEEGSPEDGPEREGPGAAEAPGGVRRGRRPSPQKTLMGMLPKESELPGGSDRAVPGREPGTVRTGGQGAAEPPSAGKRGDAWEETGETARPDIGTGTAERALTRPAVDGEERLWQEAVLRRAGAQAGTSQQYVLELVRPGAGGKEHGPREVSRAFQRDARRYDGGFGLY